MSYLIRTATVSDYVAIADVMYDAVRNGPSAYTEEQRCVWLPQLPQGEDWCKRLDAQLVIVALNAEEALGFMSLADGGYIDLAFVRPSGQRRGLFRRLFQEIERRAIARGFKRLTVHASLNAVHAFRTVGFVARHKEVVKLGSQQLERFEMDKRIDVSLSLNDEGAIESG